MTGSILVRIDEQTLPDDQRVTMMLQSAKTAGNLKAFWGLTNTRQRPNKRPFQADVSFDFSTRQALELHSSNKVCYNEKQI